jgi:hypothetical protein
MPFPVRYPGAGLENPGFGLCRPQEGFRSRNDGGTFSDQPRSYCTALGLYRVGRNYPGKHGDSYALKGYSPGNQHAEKRAIVIHSAWYCGEAFVEKNQRCGDSWGCPAVSAEVLAQLKSYLDQGIWLWIFR